MKLTIYLILFLFSSSALAASNSSMEKGFYLGISWLSGNYKINSTSKSSNQGKGMKIYLVDKTRNGLVGELHHIDLNFEKSGGSEDSLQIKSIGYSLLIHFDAGETLFPFVKVGYHQWNTGFYISDTEKKLANGADFFYGLGMNIKFAKSWLARVEYEVLTVKANDGINKNTANIGLNSISLVYKF